MDLFKAIFAGSSDETSSSSSSDEEEQEQQQEEEEEAPHLFNITPAPEPSVSSVTAPQTGRTIVHQQPVLSTLHCMRLFLRTTPHCL